MKGSDSHANKLAFYFLSNRRHRDDDAQVGALKRGEVDFLKEIRAEQAAEEEEEGEDDAEAMDDESSMQKQEGSKMYRFFQQMKDVGISSPKA